MNLSLQFEVKVVADQLKVKNKREIEFVLHPQQAQFSDICFRFFRSSFWCRFFVCWYSIYYLSVKSRSWGFSQRSKNGGTRAARLISKSELIIYWTSYSRMENENVLVLVEIVLSFLEQLFYYPRKECALVQ